MSPSNKEVKKYRTGSTVVVCHDAGGAQVIAAYLKTKRLQGRSYCLVAGPAKEIFTRQKIKCISLDTDRDPFTILQSYGPIRRLIAGVGWSSPIELAYIDAAKKLGIPTSVLIDHWVNYRERFGYPRAKWYTRLPDEIIAGDPFALKLAKRFFHTHAHVRYVPNAYFSDIQKRCSAVAVKSKRDGRKILFMSEPISKPANSFGDLGLMRYTEYDVFSMLIRSLLRCGFRGALVIRFHPTEDKDKYATIRKNKKLPFTIECSDRKDIVADCARVNVVIGVESMALVIASFCHARTISFIPDVKYRSMLPTKNIEQVRTQSALDKLFCKLAAAYEW